MVASKCSCAKYSSPKLNKTQVFLPEILSWIPDLTFAVDCGECCPRCGFWFSGNFSPLKRFGLQRVRNLSVVAISSQ